MSENQSVLRSELKFDSADVLDAHRRLLRICDIVRRFENFRKCGFTYRFANLLNKLENVAYGAMYDIVDEFQSIEESENCEYENEGCGCKIKEKNE